MAYILINFGKIVWKYIFVFVPLCEYFLFYFVNHSPLNNLIWKKKKQQQHWFNQFTSLVLPSVSGVTAVRGFVYISSGIFLRVGNGPGQRDGRYHQNKKQHQLRVANCGRHDTLSRPKMQRTKTLLN